MQQIKFETKKIMCNKLFLISTAILIGYYIFMIISGIPMYASSPKGNAKFFAQAPESPTSQYIYELEQEQNDMFEFVFIPNDPPYPPGEYGSTLMEDYNIISNYTEQVRYSQSTFDRDMTLMVEKLYDEMKNAKSRGNNYIYRYNEKAISIYNNKIDIPIIDSKNAKGSFEIFHHSRESTIFSTLLIMWSAFISAFCYTSESTYKISNNVHSTPNGRRKLLLNKTAALTIIIFIMCFAAFIVEFLVSVFAFKVTDLFVPIQATPHFQFSGFRLNILTTMILTNFMRFIALIFVVGIVSVLSIKARSLIRPMILSFIFFAGASYMLMVIISIHELKAVNIFSVVRMYFPLALTQPNDYLTKFDYGNLFSFPANRLTVSIGVFLISFSLCIWISSKFYGGGRLRWKKEN